MPELSPLDRAAIMGAHYCGTSQHKISKCLNIPRSTVRYTIKQAEERDNHASKPRSGRPPIPREQAPSDTENTN
ncbi:hypothetical protein KEM56_002320 [Ascosphaera pollenicola]|nr:hypothetical protein KEM56_002320 [Ascosphaera pollenicola]